MRFQLIDRVTERGRDYLVAVKTVTKSEEYLADHFPGFEVLPGVMMLEAMVQAGRLLLDAAVATPGSGGGEASCGPWIMTEARNVRYGNMVRPGQSLQVRVTVRERTGDVWSLEGAGTVEGRVAVQGRFKLSALPSDS